MEQFAAPSIQQAATDVVHAIFRHGLLWYRIPAAVASLLLLLACIGGSGPSQGEAGGRLRRGDYLYLIALAFFLVAMRWPALAVGDLEGDEGVAVSAALTRFLDPGHGVTLFTGSAGPLLTYPVAALGLLGIRIDFGASKLVSLLLLIATSGMLYLALRTLAEARTARVALLPLPIFLGISNTRWTLSYCSEQWINLLAVAMVYFLLRLAHRRGRETSNLVGFGLAVGLIPLIKWQGAPIAALFVLVAAAIVWGRWRRERAGLRALAWRLLPLAATGLAPLASWCVILWSFGGLGYFFETYFVALFTQASSRYSTTMLERLIALPEWAVYPDPESFWFLFSTLLFLIPAGLYLGLARRARRFRLELALSVLYLLISVYAVLQPGGLFLHYLNLLLIPYTALLMLVFCRLMSIATRPQLVLVAYLVLAVLAPALQQSQDAPLPVRFRPFAVRSKSIDALRELNETGSPLIMWGWVYAYYVSTGMTWGTQTGGSHEILEPFFPDKSIYIADYVASLESGRAPVFLDTATEGSPVYAIRAQYGHQRIPEIRDAVRRNYFRCAEFPGARVYLNRKRYGTRREIRAWCAGLPHERPPPTPGPQAASSLSWRS